MLEIVELNSNKTDNCDEVAEELLNKDEGKTIKATTQNLMSTLQKKIQDTTCGFWIFKGVFFQRFANQTAYAIIYGLVGCAFSMTYGYFNGTISTIEKRFKISSRNTGIIMTGYDISQVMMSAVISYYAGKGHRPRWIGFGLLTIVAYCLLTAAPHFIYGAGTAALALTTEFGSVYDKNATTSAIEEQRTKLLCHLKVADSECELHEDSFTPQVLLFSAQLISGIGGTIYAALGIAYMDDNTKKSKTPTLLSLSYFLRMLGPACGYAMASFFLRFYIAPELHPAIDNADPRWLGAWWLGWLIIASIIFISGIFLCMFPKELPLAVEQRMRAVAQLCDGTDLEQTLLIDLGVKQQIEAKASFSDMWQTFRRLLSNKTLMCNNFSSVFYFFGYTPYWIFTPKYIEIQYRQSAAIASMVTGSVALVFSAVGVLLSGFVISKYKPRARYMAAWNVIVGCLTVSGIILYAFIGCPENENSLVVNILDSAVAYSKPTCNSACNCDYVQYTPVCGENGMTYISPCHAGCKKYYDGVNGEKTFHECSCIVQTPYNNGSKPIFEPLMDIDWSELNKSAGNLSAQPLMTTTEFLEGQAVAGSCPVNCFTQFVTFLAVMCLLKFIGAAGRASNFLVSVRCVPEKDKTASMGLDMMLMCLLAFIPGPIFFGWLMDGVCLVWGKTCSNQGNCWLYDSVALRYTLNITAAIFISISVIFDCGVWYFVKDLKIFDEEAQQLDMKIVGNEEEKCTEKM